MLIAQVSDFHVTRPGRLAYGRVRTQAMLARAVKVLNALPQQPDLVVGSGDLVQGGAGEEYEALRETLSKLKAPFAPAAGNHDERGALREAFPEVPWSDTAAPFAQYAVDLADLRVVVLDTVTPGSDEASFCADRARWLDEELSASPLRALVVTHHPPFPTAIPWMDPEPLDWTQGLARVIARHPGKVAGVISGHIHRAIHTRFAGVPASSCPSTAHQVALDFAADRPLLSTEAPGFQLHRWEDGTLTTYTASLERFGQDFAP